MSAQAASYPALVLRLRPFGEADRMVELLTSELGRVSAVARNARKSRRRFGGALDLVVSGEAILRAGKGMMSLESFRAQRLRLELRSSLQSYQRAMRLLEVLGHATPVQQPFALFGQVEQAFDALAHGDNRTFLEIYPRLMHASGCAPDFTSCVQCESVAQRYVALDAGRGGGICERCQPGSVMHPHMIAWLQGSFDGELSTNDAARLETIVLRWFESELGRPLKTLSRSHTKARAEAPARR